MDRSESIVNLVAALAKAQGSMENPKFDSINPHFTSRYCSLAALRDAVLPPLAAHGLALVQPVSHSAVHELVCETVLFHESGEWLSTSLTHPLPERVTPQGLAGLATYLKRIALQAFLCVAGESDDDGETATQAQTSTQVRDAIDTYTYDGIAERITQIFTDLAVPQAKR